MFSDDEDMNNQELIQKKKNTFVFESFNDKLKKINVRITNKMINSEMFLDNKFEIKEEISYKDQDSNFISSIKREKQLNYSEEFLIVYDELEPYIKSFVLIVNNAKIILEILKKYLEYSYYERNKSTQLTISLLEILCGLIKDIRGESFELFLNFIFKELVMYLRQQLEVELIDKIFSVFTNIFKFLNKQIINNFDEFFNIYAELLFNKNANIRKFGCESICFILKNLDNYNIAMINTIFEPFSNPSKFFSYDNSEQFDSKDYDSSYSYYNYLKSKNQLQESLINNHDLFYIFDCISDLFVEVLIGVNKALSIKADMFICKITQSLKNDSNKYLLHSIIIYTMIKLRKRIQNTDKQQNVVKLLYYYLLINIDFEEYKSVQYQNKNYEYFNSLFMKQNLKEEILFCLILYNKESLVKFHIKLDKSTLLSLIDQMNIISNSLPCINNEYLLANYLELLAILMKLNQHEFSEKMNGDNQLCISKILPMLNIPLIMKFLSDLNTVKNYKNFKKYSLFNIYKEENLEEEEEENDFNYSKFKEIFQLLVCNFKNENKIEILVFFSYLSLLVKEDFSFKVENSDNIFTLLKEILQEKVTLLEQNIQNKDSSKYYFYNIIELSVCFLLIHSYFSTCEEISKLYLRFVNSFISLIDANENRNILNSNSQESNEIFNVVFSHIKDENKYYISKIDFYFSLFYKLLKRSYKIINEETLINIVDKSLNNINCPFSFKVITFLAERNEQLGNYIIQKINKKRLFLNLLLNDKDSRHQTLCYIYKLLKIEETNQSEILTSIFDIMKKISSFEQDFQNQKSFSFNFEILISKFELLADPSSELIDVIYLFLFGSFWIRLQKGVWPSINKALESFCSISTHKIFNTHFSLFESFNEILINFISVEGYLQKFDSKIKEKFFILEFENKLHINYNNYLEVFVRNTTHKLFYKKFIKQNYVETYVEGYLQGIMQTSKIVNLTEDLDRFISYVYNILSRGSDLEKENLFGNIDNLINQNDYFLCLIKNIISENYNDQSKVKELIN